MIYLWVLSPPPGWYRDSHTARLCSVRDSSLLARSVLKVGSSEASLRSPVISSPLASLDTARSHVVSICIRRLPPGGQQQQLPRQRHLLHQPLPRPAPALPRGRQPQQTAPRVLTTDV